MSIFSQTTGVGADLVFIHGWGMNGDVWEDVVKALASHFRVTIVDLPGHGRSYEHLRDYTLPNLATEVKNVLPGQSTIIGWSMGGQVATQLALDYPELVDRCVVVASAPQFASSTDWPNGVDPKILSDFAGDFRSDFKNTVKRFIAITAMGSDNPQDLQRTLRERVFRHGDPQIAALEAGLNILHTANLRNRLQSIHCPVLLITGEHDTLFRQTAAKETQALYRNAQLEILKGAGHAPFIDKPNEFLTALNKFLSETTQ